MEDMLDHLRAKKALAEEQLRASTSKNPELAGDVRRIEGRIQLLEEMLDDQLRSLWRDIPARQSSSARPGWFGRKQKSHPKVAQPLCEHVYSPGLG